jgi:hypothetical protein
MKDESNNSAGSLRDLPDTERLELFRGQLLEMCQRLGVEVDELDVWLLSAAPRMFRFFDVTRQGGYGELNVGQNKRIDERALNAWEDRRHKRWFVDASRR